MSLVRRLLGIGLCLLAGWLIGYVQGIQSIVDVAINVTNQVGPTIPNIPPVEASTITHIFGLYAKGDLNPDYGSFWEFGIVLAVVGFLLVARGDRQPRSAEEAEPLLLQPLRDNQQE